MRKIKHIFIPFFTFLMIFSNKSFGQIVKDYALIEGQLIDDSKNISPFEYYKNIVEFNNTNKNIRLRSTYTHKLDSSYSRVQSLGGSYHELKSELLFDNDNLKEFTLTFDFDQDSEVYVPKSNNVLKYNKKDLLIRQTYHSWDGNYDNLDESNPLIKRQYYYNENNQIIKDEVQDWFDISINVIPTIMKYNYDSMGLLSAVNRFSWSEEDNDHLLNGVTDYRYNEKNQLKEIVTRGIHPTIIRSYFDSILIQYNDKDLLEKETNYFQESNGNIYLKEAYEYIYDDDNKLIEEIKFENFQESQQKWFTENKITYHYDSSGNITSERYFGRTLNDFEWGYNREIKYRHDSNLSSTNTQIPRKNISNFFSTILDNSQVNVLTLYQLFAGEVGFQFVLADEFKYFYSPLITNTVDNLSVRYQVTLSPNPTSDFLKITIDNYTDLADVTIWDSQGRVLTQTKIRSGEEISVAALDAGVYFYNVMIDGDVVSGKFVKVD